MINQPSSPPHSDRNIHSRFSGGLFDEEEHPEDSHSDLSDEDYDENEQHHSENDKDEDALSEPEHGEDNRNISQNTPQEEEKEPYIGGRNNYQHSQGAFKALTVVILITLFVLYFSLPASYQLTPRSHSTHVQANYLYNIELSSSEQYLLLFPNPFKWVKNSVNPPQNDDNVISFSDLQASSIIIPAGHPQTSPVWWHNIWRVIRLWLNPSISKQSMTDTMKYLTINNEKMLYNTIFGDEKNNATNNFQGGFLKTTVFSPFYANSSVAVDSIGYINDIVIHNYFNSTKKNQQTNPQNGLIYIKIDASSLFTMYYDMLNYLTSFSVYPPYTATFGDVYALFLQQIYVLQTTTSHSSVKNNYYYSQGENKVSLAFNVDELSFYQQYKQSIRYQYNDKKKIEQNDHKKQKPTKTILVLDNMSFKVYSSLIRIHENDYLIKLSLNTPFFDKNQIPLSNVQENTNILKNTKEITSSIVERTAGLGDFLPSGLHTHFILKFTPNSIDLHQNFHNMTKNDQFLAKLAEITDIHQKSISTQSLLPNLNGNLSILSLNQPEIHQLLMQFISALPVDSISFLLSLLIKKKKQTIKFPLFFQKNIY